MEQGFTAYYLRIKSQSSMMAAGVWQPKSKYLAQIREQISSRPDGLQSIIESRDFAQCWGGFSQEDILKTAPRNHAKDHEQIDLLRLKSNDSWMNWCEDLSCRCHYIRTSVILPYALQASNKSLA